MNDFVVTLKKDLEQFKKLDENRKFIVIVLLVVLFILSVIIGSRVAKQSFQPQPVPTEEAIPTAAPIIPATALALSPSSKTLKQGVVETVSVDLSKVAVAATDIVLTYDPTVLAVSDIQNGTVFSKVIRRRADAGTIMFSAAVDPTDKNNLKMGSVFSFKVKPLKVAESTVINFDPVKTITALEGDNTLGSTVGGIYIVVK